MVGVEMTLDADKVKKPKGDAISSAPMSPPSADEKAKPEAPQAAGAPPERPTGPAAPAAPSEETPPWAERFEAVNQKLDALSAEVAQIHKRLMRRRPTGQPGQGSPPESGSPEAEAKPDRKSRRRKVSLFKR